MKQLEQHDIKEVNGGVLYVGAYLAAHALIHAAGKLNGLRNNINKSLGSIYGDKNPGSAGGSNR
ncbi:hypothetical protein [Agaribacter marinus]|uniref:Uncharacterized protein n=1 Tax=Agaribacter marinus TaxID=1431249 RepID=A0AA37WLD4_9ALTE|nr:hypothetical protein [Agaribacter marinus]GLR71960.1 hypothetical protein GCM10007852_28680 [Agaribacter marinus]